MLDLTVQWQAQHFIKQAVIHGSTPRMTGEEKFCPAHSSHAPATLSRYKRCFYGLSIPVMLCAPPILAKSRTQETMSEQNLKDKRLSLATALKRGGLRHFVLTTVVSSTNR
eukprot:4772890-Amphidinium_carterae.1